LKTLAQFLLLGDPSIVPVTGAGSAVTSAAKAASYAAEEATAKGLFRRSATPADESSGRKSRRITLKSEGEAVAQAATFIGKQVRGTSPAKARLQDMAKQRGFSSELAMFQVDGGPSFRRAAKAFGRKQHVAIACDRQEHPDTKSGAKHIVVRVLVAHMLGDNIVSIDESVSR